MPSSKLAIIRRPCPKCGRKNALNVWGPDLTFCRWKGCDYEARGAAAHETHVEYVAGCDACDREMMERG